MERMKIELNDHEAWTIPGCLEEESLNDGARLAVQTQIDELVDEFSDMITNEPLKLASCLRELPCLKASALPDAKDVAMPPMVGLAFFIVD